MGFEKGDIIFNAIGAERVVAVDKRDQGGYLWGEASWGNGRTKLTGPWFLKCTANATLHMFFQRTEVSTEPLREQERALTRRIRRLHSYARMVALVAANGYTPVSLLQEALEGEDDYRKRKDIIDKFGEPEPQEKTKDSFIFNGYRAAVSGFPFNVAVTVYGPKDTVTIAAPEDFIIEP